ncbi:MAG: hypothetical protein ACKOZU_01490 [Planctomycetaceae bacterium]
MKPNIGKPLTIKPELAQPAAPPAAKPSAKPAGAAKHPAKPPAKPPVKSAAHKPANIKPRDAIAAKKAGKSHSRQLAKRKPR